jgi:hypothetical protein
VDHSVNRLRVGSPKSWRAERVPGGYAVRDPGGRIVAHIYGQKEAGEAGFLTMDAAREMALQIAEAGDAGLIGFRSKLALAAGSPHQGRESG